MSAPPAHSNPVNDPPPDAAGACQLMHTSPAVLQASEMGAPVYRALGFDVVFDMTAWSLPIRESE